MKILNILFITLFFIACNNKTQTVNTVTQEQGETLEENMVSLTDAQFANANIATTVLQNHTLSSTTKLNGIIDVPPQNLVSVSVPTNGYLKNTQLLPGMHIRKGQLIATIEDKEYIEMQQEYLLTKSKLHFATLEYKRQKELNASQASSDKVTQQAQAVMTDNQITLAGLESKLQLIGINPNSISNSNITKSISIFSPINGYVSKVNANIGKYVTPSDILFELINPEDIHLNIKVFEKELPFLSIGTRVIAYSNTQPNKKYPCTIILISKDVNADRTADVHCHFDNYDNILIPGMYMNAEIEMNTIAANSLPEESIVSFEGKDYIFIDEGNKKYNMQEVNIGQIQNGFAEIVNKESFTNKTIVTKGAYTLLMKLKNTEE